ncbi:MAG: methenyltetrahydromethanopterin cyclohydrolase [Pirellulales bacterium]
MSAVEDVKSTLNARASALADRAAYEADDLRLGVNVGAAGSTIIDFGVSVEGGLEAGRRLAEICLAGLGHVQFGPPVESVGPWPTVMVRTDHPAWACLGSQYAGWQLSKGKFFAMGSGPMRAAAGKEPIIEKLSFRETAKSVVGILETRSLPPADIITEIAESCWVPPEAVTILVAPTSSQAGTVQVVARSVETALHKLHELEFDVSRVVSALGTAPLPPIAADDLAAVGWTNDAILYGGQVTLWVRGDDASLEEVGPKVPSNGSVDYGLPFAQVFQNYGRDFYKIDPLLFSPAVVTFHNLDTGRTFRFGTLNREVLLRSFTL